MRIFDSIGFATYFANGDLIDKQEYDGTVSAVQSVAEDIRNFRDVWERGECYRVFVNGSTVEETWNE